MESRSRFSTQAKDPFAGSVLFGSGASPTQGHSPVVSHTSYGISPMQAMDGVSTIRSPFQSKRFGETVPLSGRKTPGNGRRPPLSSVLDDKLDMLVSQNYSDENLFAQQNTPNRSVFMSPSAGTGADAGGGDSSSFPLWSSSALRDEFASPSAFRNGAAARTAGRFGQQREGESVGAGGGLGNGFMSPAAPAPARPPLRSVVEGYNAPSSYSMDTPSHSARAGADSEAGAIVSPVLTLGAYTPSMDKLDAAWSNWIVVSGFYPSSNSRNAVVQLFLQFGDVRDHVLTSGNWLFIRYASPVHAERAASQHGTLLTADTLLSVLVLNARLAQHLNIHLDRDGTLQVDNCISNANRSSGNFNSAGSDIDPDNTIAASTAAGIGGGLRHRPRDNHNMSAEEKTLLHTHRTNSTECEEPDLYLQPRRRKTFCEKVVEYFFSY